MHDAPEHRNRVSSNIGAIVLAFCRERLRKGGRFHMQELTEYVQAREASAPASADRILRMLRAAGEVAYEVKDRRASLYELKAVRSAAPSLDAARPAPPARGGANGARDLALEQDTPVRPHVGGGPGGLFGDLPAGKGRGLDAIRGR